MNEELNEQLLKEIRLSKEIGKFTNELTELVISAIKNEINKDRYKFLTEEDKLNLISYAYDSCVKLLLKFNPDKTNKAILYLIIMIRNSFAYMIMPIARKQGKTKIITL